MPSKINHAETACTDCGQVYRHKAENTSGRCKSCRSRHANAQRRRGQRPMTNTEIEAFIEAGDARFFNFHPSQGCEASVGAGEHNDRPGAGMPRGTLPPGLE